MEVPLSTEPYIVARTDGQRSLSRDTITDFTFEEAVIALDANRASTLPQRAMLCGALGAMGLSTPEISASTCLAESTVKTHMLHLFSTLGINDRSQLPRLFIESGILVIEQKLPKAGLSQRERQVIDLVSHGQTNTEIGERLTLSPLTIKGYLEKIAYKSGVRGRRTGLVMRALLSDEVVLYSHPFGQDHASLIPLPRAEEECATYASA